jgi:hypothetical protein
MRIEEPRGWSARQAVAARHRQFIASLLKQFKTPPEELLRRAEDTAARSPRMAEIDGERISQGGS